MSKKNTPIQVVFAPGCFDDFQGTQEELDQFISDLKEAFESEEWQDQFAGMDIADDSEVDDFEKIISTSNPRLLN